MLMVFFARLNPFDFIKTSVASLATASLQKTEILSGNLQILRRTSYKFLFKIIQTGFESLSPYEDSICPRTLF